MSDTVAKVIFYSLLGVFIILGIVGVYQWANTGSIPLFQTGLTNPDCILVNIGGNTFSSIDSLNDYVVSNNIGTQSQFDVTKQNLKLENGKVYSCSYVGSSQ